MQTQIPAGGSEERTRLPATATSPVPAPAPARERWLFAMRYLLPAGAVLAGLVVMVLGSESDLEGGAGIVSAGLAIFFLNWLFRIGAAGDREREAEDAARAYYDRHGRWPR